MTSSPRPSVAPSRFLSSLPTPLLRLVALSSATVSSVVAGPAVLGPVALGSAAVGIAALSLSGCSGKAALPGDSTDTGNPPVVDVMRIQITADGSSVVVSAGPGAVTPGGAAVRVHNVTTGASVRTVASEDGSFVATLPGSVGDGYRVVVETEDGNSEATLPDAMMPGTEDPNDMMPGTEDPNDMMPGTEDPNDMMPGAPDLSCSTEAGQMQTADQTTGPEPVCPQLSAEARCRSAAAEANLDTACNTDMDCTLFTVSASCMDACGTSQLALSNTGANQAQSALNEINAGVCVPFEAEGCEFVPSPCPPPVQTQQARCVDGACALAPIENGGGEGCDPRVGCAGNNLVCVADSCDGMGTCQEVGPAACPSIYAPVCGCDGVTYGNECSLLGAPMAYEGECMN